MDVREFKTIEISKANSLSVKFLYSTLMGRLILRSIVRPVVSQRFGTLMNRRFSRRFVARFIRKNDINMAEYENIKYKSFNDFFIRKIKSGERPFPQNIDDVPAPCDGKLTAYIIQSDSVFYIKNSVFNVEEMLEDKSLAEEFNGGVCLIFRLTPDDYHRYYFIDDGEIISHKKIDGVLHTVMPISNERYDVYTQNAREYTVFETKNYGKVIQMEVGALFVGRIVNHITEGYVSRGNEKGMFEFGGSTVVMLFQKDKVVIDDLMFENTKADKETIVRLGDKVGIKA